MSDLISRVTGEQPAKNIEAEVSKIMSEGDVEQRLARLFIRAGLDAKQARQILGRMHADVDIWSVRAHMHSEK